MDGYWDPLEENDIPIVQLWDQLDETTTIYIGFSLSDIVVCVVLLYSLWYLIDRVFPNSFVIKTADASVSESDTKTMNNREVDATTNVTATVIENMERLNEQPKVHEESTHQESVITDASWIGEITEDKLRCYTASKKSIRLLVAVNGVIYDVTKSRDLYGKGKPYEKFAGREVSKALAKWSIASVDLTGVTGRLSASEARRLRQWETTFKNKYIAVGSVKQTG